MDAYRYGASIMYDVPEEFVTTAERQRFKELMFSFIYDYRNRATNVRELVRTVATAFKQRRVVQFEKPWSPYG